MNFKLLWLNQPVVFLGKLQGLFLVSQFQNFYGTMVNVFSSVPCILFSCYCPCDFYVVCIYM